MRNGLRKGYRVSRKGRRKRALVGRGLLRKIAVVPLCLFFGVGLFFLFYQALAHSGFFRISAIDIEGYGRLTKKEILELSGVDVQSNLVAVSGGEIEERIAGHPWVGRVEVSRKWPDRLLISIWERKPVAMVNLKDGLHYIDGSGEVFASLNQTGDSDYPVISGLTGMADLGDSDYSALKESLLLIKYGERGNPNLPAQNISEVRIDNRGITLFLTDRPFPIRLGRGDVWTKYSRLTKVLYWLYKKREFERVAYIHAYYPDDRILVGMEAG